MVLVKIGNFSIVYFRQNSPRKCVLLVLKRKKRLSRLSLVMNLISDIDIFSSLSFSISYVFKSRMCNVHLLSVFIFLL